MFRALSHAALNSILAVGFMKPSSTQIVPQDLFYCPRPHVIVAADDRTPIFTTFRRERSLPNAKGERKASSVDCTWRGLARAL
jgi:hypothetical protein